ncbi:alpha/beta fold hydrolase [Sphingosinicellaceae bacterium]|nr:alpha/beta fold hydrolase [Sphingosinicellaceae bacterium]
MSKPDWTIEGRDWPNRDASRFVVAGGLRWHVQVAGNGPVVLLLHGAGAASHSWRDILPRLAERFTVVAPDLPGHGFTATPDRHGLTMPGMARAVAALLSELGLAPALVVGHSAGAGVALRLSLDGLVPPVPVVALNGAMLPFPGVAAQLFPALARVLFTNPLVPRLLSLQAQMPGAVAQAIGRTGSRIDARGVELYARLFRRSGHVAGTLGMMANWDLAGLKRDLPRLASPLHLLAGERDMTIPASVSRQVAPLVPGARLEIISGLGHLMHEEQPERFAALIAKA